MKFAAALFLTLVAFAQDVIEIRGTVIEQSANVPLPGAQVTLYEVAASGTPPEIKLYGSVFTDERGVYSFKLTHLGSYRMEVKKAGYIPRQNAVGDISKLSVALTRARPRLEMTPIPFVLPGSLIGRVIDEKGKPVADLPVYVQAASAATIRPVGPMAVTNEEGVFTVSRLIAGPFVVRIAPDWVESLSVLDNSEAEFKIVDRDIESSFWPAGLADPRDVIPIQVQPGSSANIGTITLRSVPYYRARIEFKGDCAAGEMWQVALVNLDGRRGENRITTEPCRNQFLVRDLAPGSYILAVWTGKESLRWAQAPLVVTSENVEASIRFSPGSDLTARVVTPPGVSSASLSKLRIQLQAEAAPTSTTYTLTQGPEGQFSIRNIPWPRQAITIQGLPPSHYIKEILYAGQPLSGPVLSLSPGGRLDIVIDDHPATLTGKIKGYVGGQGIVPDLVQLDREHYPGGQTVPNQPYSYMGSVAADGTFRFAGLAPGEYRVKATSLGSSRLGAAGGELVKVGAGEIKTIELKLSDTSR